jgi:hypothetical protein
VIGCGAIALAVIATLKRFGAGPILAADFVASRRQLALAMGADVVIDPAEVSPYKTWRDVAAGSREATKNMMVAAGSSGSTRYPVRWTTPATRTARPGSLWCRERGGMRMSDIDDLRATVARLADQVRALEDQVEIMQLVAQYGPSVDSGRAEATASLWTEDGSFDAVPQLEMRGRGDIVDMVYGEGHQRLISNGCGHVLTVPHIVVDGDQATGRSYALNIRWDAAAGGGSGWPGSRPTRGRGCVLPPGGASRIESTRRSTALQDIGRCWPPDSDTATKSVI